MFNAQMYILYLNDANNITRKIKVLTIINYNATRYLDNRCVIHAKYEYKVLNITS